MTAHQAKLTLLACRPQGPERAQSDVAEAVALAHQDADLGDWFRSHTAFQQTLQRSFRELPVPPNLTQRILRHRPVIRPAWWRKPPVLAAAAAIALLLGLGAHWLSQPRTPEATFDTFRSRMVRSVLREYSMDIITNDMKEVRRFLAARNAPADYDVPASLAQLPVLGAGIESWGAQPVSMVCFQSPDEGTLFLFVVDDASLHPPAPASPHFLQVSQHMTASWSRNGRTYLLSTTGSRESLQRRF